MIYRLYIEGKYFGVGYKEYLLTIAHITKKNFVLKRIKNVRD